MMLRSAKGLNRFSSATGFVEWCFGLKVTAGQVNADAISMSAVITVRCLIAMFFKHLVASARNSISTFRVGHINVP